MNAQIQLDNGPARLERRPRPLQYGHTTMSTWSARSSSPPPTAIGWGRATSTSICATAPWPAAARSRARCRSAGSPPGQLQANLPNRTRRAYRPRALAYRPGWHQMSGVNALPSSPCCRCSRSRPRSASRPARRCKGHDSNAPVDVGADRIEVQDRADRAIFSGNVVATPGQYADELRPPHRRLRQQPAASTIQRLEASGGVTLRTPTETARSQFAIYDVDRRLVTMIGGVNLDPGRQPRPGRPAGARSRHPPRGDGRRRRRSRRPGHRPLHRAAAGDEPATSTAGAAH